MKDTVAVILKGYPRLSETFIAQELLGLERAGLRLALFSMRHPTDRVVHPVHRQIAAPVVYLPEYLHNDPLRVARSLLVARRLPGFGMALRTWARDLARDPSPNRFRRFGQAAVLAAEMPAGIGRLYAHFIHTPAAVARYTSLMTGLPWSCSAHAKDIWTSRDWELEANLDACTWAATCTRSGYDRLTELAPDAAKVHLVYHGLDLTRFGAIAATSSLRDGGDRQAPVRLLSVGRAVPKKGFDVLLDALATLAPDVHWRLTHIGGGDGLNHLKAKAAGLGLDDRIRWLGSQDQQAVLESYRSSDIFVLPSLIAGDGDRDGLPNVLVEAQSQRLACLSTRVSAIPELIVDGETGILVAPDNVCELADALAALIADPERRAALGAAGERRVRQHFDADDSLKPLLALFVVSSPAPAEMVEP